jgi:hypothetical protein
LFRTIGISGAQYLQQRPVFLEGYSGATRTLVVNDPFLLQNPAGRTSGQRLAHQGRRKRNIAWFGCSQIEYLRTIRAQSREKFAASLNEHLGRGLVDVAATSGVVGQGDERDYGLMWLSAHASILRHGIA